MILVIEIGGTKLQLGVFDPSRSVLVHCERLKVCRTEGAQGILNQIESALPSVLKGLDVERCGIGFGGPIHEDGSVLKSHQVTGWDCFPLAAWVREKTGLPTYVANDCDAAALAEARYGAGVNLTSMFYVTVGTGIGGGLIRHGQRQGTDRPAIA
ncbi:MAG: ROK family protein, partial [Planctomycetota bacterium]|nr:ROK family protein [Planctomycetota bacterium]